MYAHSNLYRSCTMRISFLVGLLITLLGSISAYLFDPTWGRVWWGVMVAVGTLSIAVTAILVAIDRK